MGDGTDSFHNLGQKIPLVSSIALYIQGHLSIQWEVEEHLLQCYAMQ